MEQPETLFQRRWKQLRQRFGGSPMFQRLEVPPAGGLRFPGFLLIMDPVPHMLASCHQI